MNLKEYVENNPQLVKRRPSIRYPDLYVVKYTHKVFYDGLWTPELEECRGLVVDKDWKVVVRPFKKIYNRFEQGADFAPDTRVTAVRKINGFMAAATYYEPRDEVIISTTGSLDSDFVTLAEKYLRPQVASWIAQSGHGITWLFEICDPSDPHVIEEEPGAYLIGARAFDGRLFPEVVIDPMARAMNVLRPPVYYDNIKFSTVCQLAKDCQHEGFVVHGPDKSLKIKSPYYLITKFLARKKGERLIDLLSDIPSLRRTVAEEYYPLLDYLQGHLEFPGMSEEDRIKVIKEFLSHE